jgi:hypothetical protein
MKRVSIRQVLFAVMIVATAFLTWTYSATSTPWASAGFVFRALASTGLPAESTVTVSPVASAAGSKSPARITFSAVNNWAVGYQLTYVVIDTSNASVVDSGTTDTSAFVDVTVPPGQTRMFEAQYSTTSQSQFSGGVEPTRTTSFKVYAPKSATTLSKPTVPSTKKTTKQTVKITGTISPKRTVGSTADVQMKYYRWQTVSGKKKWVWKKTLPAKMTSSSAYSVSTKLSSKGSWSVIAYAPTTDSTLSKSSSRSKTFYIK